MFFHVDQIMGGHRGLLYATWSILRLGRCACH
eukprot:COSAG01_NODE_39100_length_481_cov_0.759162_1_plen_31_part_01